MDVQWNEKWNAFMKFTKENKINLDHLLEVVVEEFPEYEKVQQDFQDISERILTAKDMKAICEIFKEEEIKTLGLDTISFLDSSSDETGKTFMFQIPKRPTWDLGLEIHFWKNGTLDLCLFAEDNDYVYDNANEIVESEYAADIQKIKDYVKSKLSVIDEIYSGYVRLRLDVLFNEKPYQLSDMLAEIV